MYQRPYRSQRIGKVVVTLPKSVNGTESTGGLSRTLSLWAAILIGVGAIVGGGIFVLAGVAFTTAGPAATVAFAINGFVALLTAMSFAEMASTFPVNGGAYTYAKNVLSVRSAFGVGWLLWFAYIVAGVLYALGFASFAALMVEGILDAFDVGIPSWLHGRRLALLFASGATLWYAASFIRSSEGGGQKETMGKILIFVVLIIAGAVALVQQEPSTTQSNITPFFSEGGSGVLLAMGFTFIALQGFDLIATVGGEVKNPQRNIPRAMFISLGCAMAIYLPLLFLISSVGVPPGQSVSAMAGSNPETIIPLAAKRFMGPIGYWLVIVAAILSTLSALSANLFAASRVALSMAKDRTLPAILRGSHPKFETPMMAIYATALTLLAIVFMIPDLAGAGAAASLIFLVCFAIVHVTTLLARTRSIAGESGYKTPWFPTVPVLGALTCGALAIFQAIIVPDAGGILAIWLGLGVMLYWSIFARSAEIGDAAREGFNPALVSMRGQQSLVLVPIANPEQAPAMVEVANVFASRKSGQVLLLSIIPIDKSAPGAIPNGLPSAEKAIGDALRQSYQNGYWPEALITVAENPMDEIGRIAEEHQCNALVLGLGNVGDSGTLAIESILRTVDADVALLGAQPSWRLVHVKKVLVPLGGRGEQHELRARILGAICRSGERNITFVTILPSDSSPRDVARARKELENFAELKVPGVSEIKVLCAANAATALTAEAEHYDLMVMGLSAVRRRQNTFSEFAIQIAQDSPCATLFLCRRYRSVEFLDPLRDDVLQSLRDVASSSPIRFGRRSTDGSSHQDSEP